MPKIRQLGAMAQAVATRAQQALYGGNPVAINVTPGAWPDPGQPVRPIGPDGSQPLSIPLWFGQNFTYTPRADQRYSAEELQSLATYPLARICIENVKDVLCELNWSIQLRETFLSSTGLTNKDRKTKAAKDPVIGQLTDMFEYPYHNKTWKDFLRPLIEDLLVIDAPAIQMIRGGGEKGKIVGLKRIPGASITCYIDENGDTPQAPEPAYAQLWQGIPRVDLTTDQLVYRPRNIVGRENIPTSFLYGTGPTEQAAQEIEIGIARLLFVKAYYTAGSIPDVVQVVPRDVPPDKIKQAMEWMNSELSGQLLARRQWRMVQGFAEQGKEDQIIFTKEKLLADAFDDLHIRKICFAYGTSPQRLLRMMNRAASGANQDAAEEEGTLPWVSWLKETMDFIIQRMMGYPNYEMSFQTQKEQDMLKEAQALTTYSAKGAKTINELREILGDDPSSQPEADQLGIVTATGWVALGESSAPQPDDDGESDKETQKLFKDGWVTMNGSHVYIATDISKLSEKQQKALASMNKCGAEKQRIADKSELKLSKALGIPRTRDNSAFDLRNDDVGIEVKTMVDGKNDKITMSKAALGRKLAEKEAEGLKTYTVVADVRGGGAAKYYISGRLGSIRLGTMQSASLAEIKEMVHQ